MAIARRAREWLGRYAPAEVAAILGALAAAQVTNDVAGPAPAALAATIGESIVFYAVVLRDLRRRRTRRPGGGST